MLGQNWITKSYENIGEQRLLENKLHRVIVDHLHIFQIVLRAARALGLNQRIVDEVNIGVTNIFASHGVTIAEVRQWIDVRANPQTVGINLPSVGKLSNHFQSARIKCSKIFKDAVVDAR